MILLNIRLVGQLPDWSVTAPLLPNLSDVIGKRIGERSEMRSTIGSVFTSDGVCYVS
jgi:hypothetical protein